MEVKQVKDYSRPPLTETRIDNKNTMQLTNLHYINKKMFVER